MTDDFKTPSDKKGAETQIVDVCVPADTTSGFTKVLQFEVPGDARRPDVVRAAYALARPQLPYTPDLASVIEFQEHLEGTQRGELSVYFWQRPIDDKPSGHEWFNRKQFVGPDSREANVETTNTLRSLNVLTDRDVATVLMSIVVGSGEVDVAKGRVLETWAQQTLADYSLLSLVLKGELAVKNVDLSGENNHTFRKTTPEERARILEGGEVFNG